ncbi:unnamed protein product [Prunus armeniaca]
MGSPISLGHIGISSKKFLSHSASSPALSKAMNSDSIVDRAMHVCLEDFQDTAAPHNVNTYPLVDLVSVLSEIQLASLYPSNIGGYLLMGWVAVKGRTKETVPFAWVRKLSPKIHRKGSKTLGDILAIFTDQNNDSLLAQHEWHVAWEQNQHKFSTKREIRLGL